MIYILLIKYFNMERNSWIIVALVIVLVAGAALMLHSPAKIDTDLTLKSEVSAVDVCNFSLKLTDSNLTPISGKDIVVSVVDDEGRIVKEDSDRTDDGGNAKISFDLKDGDYKVEASFAGDDKYKNSTGIQNLKIDKNEVRIEESSNT